MDCEDHPNQKLEAVDRIELNLLATRNDRELRILNFAKLLLWLADY